MRAAREISPGAVLLLFAASIAFLASGCTEERDLTICGIRAPADVAPDTPITLTITYNLNGCIRVQSTRHERSGNTITIFGRGEVYCTSNCACSNDYEEVRCVLPGMDAGTYRIQGAQAGGSACDGASVDPTSFDLVVR